MYKDVICMKIRTQWSGEGTEIYDNKLSVCYGNGASMYPN